MAKHPELVDEFLHVPGYIQPTDPGAVGGGMLWVDTAGGPGNYALKIRNDANTAWEAVSGGGGVNIFTALADTPASYAGQAGLFARVNGTETALEFAAAGGGGVTDFVSLTDTPAAYAGAALFGVRVNAGETGLEFVDFTGEFLPLAGGIMTGNIDFADLGEGIRFDDGAGAKFNGLKFEIVTDPEIVIGAVAPDVGGAPFIRANTGIMRIGEGLGFGFGALEMWNEGAGSWEPIIQSISDNPGDPLEFCNGDHELLLNGALTRPKYNGNDLALLSDATGEPAFAIPHNDPWNGEPLNALIIQGLSSAITPLGGGPGCVVSAGDFIRSFYGGSATPVHNPPQVRMQNQFAPGWTAWNNNPWDVQINLGCAWVGAVSIQIEVDDGVSSSVIDTFVNITDPLSLCGP
jgi:hypothetical protein